jgi:molecular chaperone HtpG
MKAIWTRPESEVEDSEFDEFYKHITHDFQEPLLRVSTSIEGTFEARALLYIPSKAPFDLYHRERLQNGVQLYVRRVFIMDECRELLPEWLRFVRGVVLGDDPRLRLGGHQLVSGVGELGPKVRRQIDDVGSFAVVIRVFRVCRIVRCA